MAVKKKISKWQDYFPSCFKPETPNPEKTKKPSSKKQSTSSSFPRISISDISASTLSELDLSTSLAGSNLHVFTLQELRVITQNFSSSNFLGEGGFGPVHKGFIDDKLRHGLKAQPVAVKLLDLDGAQGHKEWLTEVICLGQLRHPNLVKLIGYCCEEEQRLLVYEYMPRGSLENQLFRRFSISLPWSTRMKIALGAAKGLAFLHEAEKPVIYRDFKASNILLDSDFTAKLSDFGLAKDGPEGDETHVSTRVMGTQGYAAPEYIMTGHLTSASDVYSFGVVLLELLTGRKSVDKARPSREQNLVEWARPMLKNPRKLSRVIDPRLEGQYSETGARRAAELAYQCLSFRPKTRPSISRVIEVLEPLKDLEDIQFGTFVFTVSNDYDDDKDCSCVSDNKENSGSDDGEYNNHRKHKLRHRESDHKVKSPKMRHGNNRDMAAPTNSPLHIRELRESSR